MATDVSTQFVREAPEIEAQKLTLLQSAKAQVDAANAAALQGRYLTPSYQIAGFAPDQVRAMEAARTGIGAYQPYMSAATQQATNAGGTLNEAINTLYGADTRNQFAAAQAAMNQAAIPMQRLGSSAELATRGTNLIDIGRGGMQEGQGMIAGGIGALVGAAEGRYRPQYGQEFMNPYQQSVIDESLRQINRQGDIARQNLQAQAVRSGAFGGSREGIQRAELERALSEQRNAAILGGLQQGYNTAQQQAQTAFEQQQQRQLGAGQAITAGGTQYGQLAGQMAGLSGLYGQLAGQQANIYGQQAQLGQQMAQGIGSLAGQQFGIGQGIAQGLGQFGGQQAGLSAQLANLGAQQQALGQQDVNFLYNIGAQQQRQNQAVLDAQRQNQLQQNMQPYQQLGFLSDIYKGAPSTQMGMVQQSQAQASPFQQIAGLGVAGVSAAAAGAKAGLF